MGRPLDCANELEGVLRKYLDCHYTDFGVKANDNLTMYDWKSPINFALGHRYASSNNDSDVKKAISLFLGDKLVGQNICDVVDRHEYYGFSSQDEAYNYIKETIENLKEILCDTPR